MIKYGFIKSSSIFKRAKKRCIGSVLFSFWLILLISFIGVSSLFNGQSKKIYKFIYAKSWNNNLKVDLGDENKYSKDINLGVEALENPGSTSTDSSKWIGSKVYYGIDKDKGIPWRVLDKDSDEGVFLFADDTIFYEMYYNYAFINATWSTSTMRCYLNGYIYEGGLYDSGVVIDYTSDNFINMYFSKDEASAIAASYIRTKDAANGFSGGNDTIDKVFLLSIEEMQNKAYGFANNSTRANAGGTETDGWWWLRSPGTRSMAYAAFVEKNGIISTSGQNVHFGYKGGRGVRPAFKLDRSSILFTNSSEIPKTSYGKFGSYESAVKYRESDESTLKLTLRGTNESLDVHTEDNVVTKGGDMSITIKHKQASILDKADQISAMLLDSEGNVIYYGMINDDVNVTESTVIIPEEIEEGNYTLRVFSEDINQNNLTDYASEFSDLDIVVQPGIQVSEIKDIPTKAELGEMIYLNSRVEPANSTFNKVEFRIKDAGNTGAEVKDNILTTDKNGQEGKIVMTAYIKNGLLMGKDYEQEFTINIKKPHIAVDNIIEVPGGSLAGSQIELLGIVEPDTATFKEIIWSVKEPIDGVRIEDGNRFIADKPGRYILCARIINGLGIGIDYIQEVVIEVVEETTEIPPDTDNPGENIPGEDVPGEDVPGEDIPEEDVPGEDVPDEDVPGEDIPGEDVPDEDISDEDQPEDEIKNEDISNKEEILEEETTDDDMVKDDSFYEFVIDGKLEGTVCTGDRINKNIIGGLIKLVLVLMGILCTVKKSRDKL